MKTLLKLLLFATCLYFFWKGMVWLDGPEEPVQTAERAMADTIPFPPHTDTVNWFYNDVDSTYAKSSGRWHRMYFKGNSWPEVTIQSTTWIGEDTVIARWSNGQTDTLTREMRHIIPYSSNDGMLLPDRGNGTPQKLKNEIRKQFTP